MKMNFLHKSVGSALGIGYVPFAPGTFGALGGLISAWLIKINSPEPNLLLLILITAFTFIGVYSSGKLIPIWGNDPGKIVIDEVLGMWVTVLFLPTTIWVMIVAFIFFRLFDITKPFFISKLENIPNGWGIILDDLAAGLIANLSTQIVIVVSKNLL